MDLLEPREIAGPPGDSKACEALVSNEELPDVLTLLCGEVSESPPDGGNGNDMVGQGSVGDGAVGDSVSCIAVGKGDETHEVLFQGVDVTEMAPCEGDTKDPALAVSTPGPTFSDALASPLGHQDYPQAGGLRGGDLDIEPIPLQRGNHE